MKGPNCEQHDDGRSNPQMGYVLIKTMMHFSAVSSWLSYKACWVAQVERLYTGPQDSDIAAHMRACNPAGPLVVHIAKLFPKSDASAFDGFGRILSGTVKLGDKVRRPLPITSGSMKGSAAVMPAVAPPVRGAARQRKCEAESVTRQLVSAFASRRDYTCACTVYK